MTKRMLRLAYLIKKHFFNYWKQYEKEHGPVSTGEVVYIDDEDQKVCFIMATGNSRRFLLDKFLRAKKSSLVS